MRSPHPRRPVPIVSIATGSGSAGKTTTVVSLAALAASRQRRQVLVIDADPQGNATASCGVQHADVIHETGDVLLRRVTAANAIVDTPTPGVRLLPATPRLAEDLVHLATEPLPQTRLKRALRHLVGFDLVLIDCPGAINLMTVAALVALTSVVACTRPSAKEMHGLAPLEEVIAQVADDLDTELKLGAVVPCEVPGASAGFTYAEALGQLKELYGSILTSSVRRRAVVPEAFAHAKPVPVYAPASDVTRDYSAVLDDLARLRVL